MLRENCSLLLEEKKFQVSVSQREDVESYHVKV